MTLQESRDSHDVKRHYIFYITLSSEGGQRLLAGIVALPARKPVTGVDANHLTFCLFSDTSSFMMFSLFSAAVLLLHDRMRYT